MSISRVDWHGPGYERLDSAISGITVFRGREPVPSPHAPSFATEAWERFRPEMLHEVPTGWGVGLLEVRCDQCGSELAVARPRLGPCPICRGELRGAPTTVQRIRPRLILGSVVDPERVGDSVRQRLAQRSLLPGRRNPAIGIESVELVYVPFWLVQSKTLGSWAADVPHERTYTDTEYRFGETVSVTRSETVYEPETGEIADYPEITAVAASASPRLAALVDDEDLDWSTARPLERSDLTAAVLGIHDIDLHVAWVDAHRRRNVEAVEASVPSGSRNIRATVRHTDEYWTLALAPVYVVTHRSPGRSGQVAVNGLSGKLVGADSAADGGYAGFFVVVFFALLVLALLAGSAAGPVPIVGSALIVGLMILLALSVRAMLEAPRPR